MQFISSMKCNGHNNLISIPLIETEGANIRACLSSSPKDWWLAGSDKGMEYIRLINTSLNRKVKNVPDFFKGITNIRRLPEPKR
jgi:hypothetical protein